MDSFIIFEITAAIVQADFDNLYFEVADMVLTANSANSESYSETSMTFLSSVSWRLELLQAFEALLWLGFAAKIVLVTSMSLE